MSKQKNDFSKFTAKKEMIMSPEKKRGKLILFFLALGVAAGLTSTVAIKMMSGNANEGSKGAIFGNSSVNGDISHPLIDFEAGVLRYFTFKADPVTTVKYFIVIGEYGLIAARFDACAECWRSGDGHRQEGDSLLCNTCGNSDQITDLDQISDPCIPLPLEAWIKDENVYVSTAALQKMGKYFKAIKGEI